jgi:hypothetical protein
MRAATKLAGSELISTLLEIRQATAGALAFDHVAREYGKRALSERDRELSDATADTLVGATIDIVRSSARLRLNYRSREGHCQKFLTVATRLSA